MKPSRLLLGAALAMSVGISGCGNGQGAPASSSEDPARSLHGSVFLSVFCRHPGSDACDTVVIDAQNTRPRPAKLTATLWGREITLHPLEGRHGTKPDGHFWRARLRSAGLQAPPIRYRPWNLSEPKPRPAIPLKLQAELEDGSLATKSAKTFIVLPDMAQSYREKKLGFSYQVPFRHTTAVSPQPVVGWRAARRSLTPSLSRPREIFSAGTFRLRPGGTCGPKVALRDMGRHDALVSVQEFTGNRMDDPDFPPRPTRFQEDPGHFGCFSGPNRLVTLISFSDHGRRFTAILARGDRASPGIVRQARGILEALRFDEGSHRAR